MSDSVRRCTALTVLNLKGGVGKTHTVWLLASVCQEAGLRTLLIDTDTQANLTGSFLAASDDAPGVEALFDPAREVSPLMLIRPTQYADIDLLPSSSRLAPFDLSDQKNWETADLHLSLVDALNALRPRYDFIIIDCPPRLSLVSFAALCACDGVIVPLEAADWGAQGIVQVTAAIDHVREQHNHQLELLGYLVSRYKRGRAYQQSYMKALKLKFGGFTFDTMIPDLAAFEKSVTDRIPITIHNPRSSAAAVARQLFREVCRRTQRDSRGRPAGRGANAVHERPALARS